MLRDKVYLALTGTERGDGRAVYRLMATNDYEVSEDEVLGAGVDVLNLAKEEALKHLCAIVREQLGSHPCIFLHEEIGGAGRARRRFGWGFYQLDRKAGISGERREPR